jgi:hypothetical protein
MRHSAGRLAAIAITVAAGWIGSVSPAPGQDLAKSPLRLETTTEQPNTFGTQDYTVTVVPAIALNPADSSDVYYTYVDLSRSGPAGAVVDFYAPIDLPPGAIIDYIGLNTLTGQPAELGVALYRRYSNGGVFTVGTFSSTVHGGWGMDYNAAPLNYFIDTQRTSFIVHVQQGNFPGQVFFFGHVEVWWRRTVSPDPAGATFNDVPVGHSFHRFIEALAASGITAGCGGGNFCPDSPLTRGQMAVFLAKALGLHWGSQR